MYKFPALFLLLQVVRLCQAGVLIWGAESLQLPSLKQFNNEDFDLLKSYMRRPKVVVFRGNPMEISSELQSLLRNKYTAYVPSSSLNVDNVIELKGDAASNFKLIEDTLNRSARESDNILALILTNHEAARAPRPKRDAEEDVTTGVPEASTDATEAYYESAANEQYEPINGPVMYEAKTRTTDEVVMIYSSETPVLQINASRYQLGKPRTATVNDRPDRYRELSVSTSIESAHKVVLRFKFTSSLGYWYLNTVTLVGVTEKSIALNATRADEISAAERFSYHCSRTTIFRNEENAIELRLVNVQAQPDARNPRFDDAYDCVYFTTVPIWSGLYVVGILLVGLAVGIGALNSIRTMDKFDNNKTKQLTIATGE